jgi:hypothetical protein
MAANPLYIPQRIVDVTRQLFIADKILRSAGSAPGGTVLYWESSPVFPDGTAEIVNEFAEIPVVPALVGEPKTERARRRALALLVSEDMRRRNSRDLIEKQVIQIRNALIKSVDGAFMAALTGSTPNTRAAAAVWAGSTSAIRRDINAAKQQITDQQKGFMPDTLLIHPSRSTDLLSSAEFVAPYTDALRTQNPLITGELPGTILGLKPLVSYQVPATEAWVLEAKTVGGIADERALRATELYYRQENESWRTDVSRISAGFIDEPQAATRITGTA